MRRLEALFPISQANSVEMKILRNQSIKFATRQYLDFDLELKRVPYLSC